MADYPSQKLKEEKGKLGLTGSIIDTNIEGRGPEEKTIRAGARKN